MFGGEFKDNAGGGVWIPVTALTLDGDYVDASIAGSREDGQVAWVRGDNLVAVVSKRD